MKRNIIYLSFPSLLFLFYFFWVPAGMARLASSRIEPLPSSTPSATSASKFHTSTPPPPGSQLVNETLTMPNSSAPARAAGMNATGTDTAGTPTSMPAASPPGMGMLELFYSYFPFIEHRLPTPTPTFTPTPTETPDIPPRDTLFCASLRRPLPIPDNDPSGVENSLSIPDLGVIVDLDVYINVEHTWIGDVSVQITHQETGHGALLLDRAGIPGSDSGCSNDDAIAILDDGASLPVENECDSSSPAISGTYRPQEALSIFKGENTSGSWTIRAADGNPGDTGRLVGWCMELSTAGSLPPPPPAPTPTQLPASANVSGVTGQDQALPLDCESRSAVDWARFFGARIGEFEFFNRLPVSDNPEQGFVGDVYGTWGQIPPGDYGVHALPVAALLRDYGVEAYAYRHLRWRDVQAEIAAGRPIIVWVIGQAWKGVPVYYTPSGGDFTVVAPYEHTVMVVGYTQDTVTIQDGSKRYTRSLHDFLQSWSALRNMAILAHP